MHPIVFIGILAGFVCTAEFTRRDFISEGGTEKQAWRVGLIAAMIYLLIITIILSLIY